MALPAFTGDEIRKRLQAYDRTPFLDLLAIMLECSPSADAITRMAEKTPDKYIAALSQLARTSGFTDKTEQTHTINLNIGTMSDSQLEDRARAIASQLQLPAPVAEYTEFEEVHDISHNGDLTHGQSNFPHGRPKS